MMALLIYLYTIHNNAKLKPIHWFDYFCAYP